MLNTYVSNSKKCSISTYAPPLKETVALSPPHCTTWPACLSLMKCGVCEMVEPDKATICFEELAQELCSINLQQVHTYVFWFYP